MVTSHSMDMRNNLSTLGYGWTITAKKMRMGLVFISWLKLYETIRLEQKTTLFFGIGSQNMD